MNTHDLLLVYSGTVFEEDTLTLEQLCHACNVNTDWVTGLIEESIIEPQGKNSQSWRFSGSSLLRVRFALRLQRDLGVNLAGIALALDLMEELKHLRIKTQNSV